MSIARGLTKRMKRNDGEKSPTPAPPLPGRSLTVKTPGKNIDRSQISAPVALVSTTNMLSYNAPDIATLDIEAIRQASPSLASTHSADESDRSISTRSTRSRASSHASRETLTDASSVNSSPTSPAPNHLSGYFASANKNLRKSASSGNLQQLKEAVEEEEPVPAIPERALSHSKRAHERVAHKRSLQNMPRSQSTRASHQSARSSREHRTSLDMFKASIQEESHPFGKELEQLSEVAEEFGGVVRDAEMEADLAIIREKNLATFCAADYLAEIQPLFYTRFGIPHAPSPMAWI
ncbi:hypothetical protein K458DRAFT_405748 [Lentithecium fluviatile CBS 122367]|uniref:Uncharacterized protein n=1 Tax=Lentithecium fluviatile CBS 122367 TaxID=1168545 RepID=A0A6G1IW64_9PLEO|nr:hypothetical protein K458DRAFT_405748 [Lentithecium fluviatile CBS 122367]